MGDGEQEYFRPDSKDQLKILYPYGAQVTELLQKVGFINEETMVYAGLQKRCQVQQSLLALSTGTITFTIFLVVEQPGQPQDHWFYPGVQIFGIPSWSSRFKW
eukprot:TRINITY_DN19089_c1_g1_i1.p1 TRINITY_DN19089_c1_g1~~TRINITY_DN19089_c1_g1_i1.p1  ORF type:complete len:103 (-),score=18.66 TRINITY_DN19089_c1_g1_i1:76-384(-)